MVRSSTYHFLTDDYLQSADKDQQGNRTHDAVVKFDTYRNLQRHLAVPSCDSTAFLLIDACSYFYRAMRGIFFHVVRPIVCL